MTREAGGAAPPPRAMKKLFIVIRGDIAPGLQAAQACHALQAMNDQHPETIADWEGNLVVLSAPGARELSEIICGLQRARYKLSTFCEPDLGGELTAAAITGDAWRQLSHLPLALRVKRSS